MGFQNIKMKIKIKYINIINDIKSYKCYNVNITYKKNIS